MAAWALGFPGDAAQLPAGLAERGWCVISGGAYGIDVAAHRAFQGERELHLTAKEFDLLRVLVAASGTVVSRDTLMREVWGTDPSGSTKTLDMHVSWLRRKLGETAAEPRYLQTVRGVGIRLVDPGTEH